MNRTALRLFFVISVAPLTSLASPSVAAAEVSRAADSKSRADRAMDQGQYADALAAYRHAYALEPTPALLYNVGRAQEKLGRSAEALSTLEAFAATASPDLKAKVPRLEELLSDLRARVTQLWVRTNVKGATVIVRREQVGVTPLAKRLLVMPGAAQLEVRAEGFAPYTRELVLEEGRTMIVDVALVPTAASSTTTTGGETLTDVDQPITKRWWFWTGVGVVLAGGAVLTVALVNTPRSAPQGDIEPRQMTAPLLRF